MVVLACGGPFWLGLFMPFILAFLLELEKKHKRR
jgi:hypothetical protein